MDSDFFEVERRSGLILTFIDLHPLELARIADTDLLLRNKLPDLAGEPRLLNPKKIIKIANKKSKIYNFFHPKNSKRDGRKLSK